MKEAVRNEIVRQRESGASLRRIALNLHLSREAVRRVLAEVRAARTAAGEAGGLPARRRKRRAGKLDPYLDYIRDLLERYPNITAQRVYEEVRGRGYGGGYVLVSKRVRELRPRPARSPVLRFETAPGEQAQMDYAVYDLDFTEEGRRRVSLFSYVLGYSRRQYLRFVEAQDFETTVREHVRAFAHLGGVAAACLYDNMKVVVLRHEDGEPIYNPRFLAFATHYGFRPVACRPRRPQTKGKVERPFAFVESSLLNGRTFRNLDQLNEVAAWWLAHVADVRVHGETKKRPLDAHAEERPRLIPLPANPYDVATVVYRTVNAEGFVAYRQNFYSVPWRHIGQVLPVRVTEDEVVVYGPQLAEIARHRLLGRGQSGQRSERPEHRPSEDPKQRQAWLIERFADLGPSGRRFFEELVREQRCGKSQAEKILALLGTYRRADLHAALERAVRFGAYAFAAVERILAAQARPKSALEALADTEPFSVAELLPSAPVRPRAPAEYQPLLTAATPTEADTEPTAPAAATTAATEPTAPAPETIMETESTAAADVTAAADTEWTAPSAASPAAPTSSEVSAHGQND